jgi:hypothetical protein
MKLGPFSFKWPWYDFNNYDAIQIFEVSNWFALALCKNWTPGYSIYKTMLLNPSHQLQIRIIPGILFIFGCWRYK